MAFKQFPNRKPQKMSCLTNTILYKFKGQCTSTMGLERFVIFVYLLNSFLLYFFSLTRLVSIIRNSKRFFILSRFKKYFIFDKKWNTFLIILCFNNIMFDYYHYLYAHTVWLSIVIVAEIPNPKLAFMLTSHSLRACLKKQIFFHINF